MVLSGTLLPGSSPGITTIEGDFTQTDDGLLQIEMGGLTPGTEHDQVRVSGVVSLGGRYEFPLIDSSVDFPIAGQSITFIETFNGGSIAAGTRPLEATAPGLSAFEDLAFRIVSTPGLGGNVKLEFVPSSAISFDGTGTESDWFATGSNPNWDLPRNPDLTDNTKVENQTSVAQRVVIDSVNPDTLTNVADVRGLVVGKLSGASANDITVAIEPGFALAATIGNVTIGDGGIIELNDAILSAPTSQIIEIKSGGLLAGNGTIRSGDLVISNGGALRPGFSVGHLDVEGNYQQGAGGALEIDLEGTSAAAQIDTITVTGDAQVGGTLRINAAGFVLGTPGEAIAIIDANTGGGEFESVETIGNNGIYFAPLYGSGSGGGSEFGGSGGDVACDVYVCVGGYYRGDMNRNTIFDAGDINKFALALTNALAYYNQFGISGSQSGNMDGLGGIDYDDIPLFRQIMQQNGVSTAGLAAAIERFSKPSVPEPGSVVLMLCSGAFLLSLSKRRPRGNSPAVAPNIFNANA
jgi:hypothetical protein